MKLHSKKQVKAAFWHENPCCASIRRKGGHNAQCADVRVAFCEWLDDANKAGRVSDSLADRATLD